MRFLGIWLPEGSDFSIEILAEFRRDRSEGNDGSAGAVDFQLRFSRTIEQTGQRKARWGAGTVCFGRWFLIAGKPNGIFLEFGNAKNSNEFFLENQNARFSNEIFLEFTFYRCSLNGCMDSGSHRFPSVCRIAGLLAVTAPAKERMQSLQPSGLSPHLTGFHYQKTGQRVISDRLRVFLIQFSSVLFLLLQAQP